MSYLPDKFTVLHVDNDSHILDASKRVLPQEDGRLAVETMTDPVDAVDSIQETNYDAVISDYQMLKMDGLELLDTVRQEHDQTLPFILFTGHNREEVVAEALNLDADRYVRKEGDPEAQLAEVADAVIQEIEHTNPPADHQVNDRKAKLREYAAAIEATDDSIYMLDTAGNYVFANQEHLNRLAADGKILEAEEPEVIDRSYADIHPEPDVDRIIDTLHEVLESNEPKTEEYAFKTVDTWSYRTYSPVSDPETEDRIGIVIISKDITQRKRIEQREAFLSSLLRHDVKNKLHTADGYLDLIDDDCSPTARDHIETATRALSDSIQLIEQTGILSGLATEETEVCPLHEVLEEVIDSYRSQAAAKGITLNYDGFQGSVLAGPLLESLFRNLIDNALTHSNADVIDISCRQDGDEYVVVVADDGDGIPTESATQLLEQGFSEGSTAGTGLGLYLVKEIANTYDGSVELDGSEAGGLRVAVQFQAA